LKFLNALRVARSVRDAANLIDEILAAQRGGLRDLLLEDGRTLLREFRRGLPEPARAHPRPITGLLAAAAVAQASRDAAANQFHRKAEVLRCTLRVLWFDGLNSLATQIELLSASDRQLFELVLSVLRTPSLAELQTESGNDQIR